MTAAAVTADATTPRDAIADARRVLTTEARALEVLAASIDQTFADAVEAVLASTGRTIVTGVGKSGHIARKISATLASTGSPSLYVHPTEASHGDLGMITRDDVVIALSNSGNTGELSDILAYTRRWSIPLIGMTGNAQSILGEQSDICLLVPKQPEACPMGLAPTTSTTMMLALGDALAVALLARRGFTAEDFGRYHPGGRLGAKLVRVEKLMHAGAAVPLLPLGATMQQAILEISAKALGCVGITDQAGHLTGLITDGDLRRHLSPELLAEPVERVMTSCPRTIRPDALAAEALGVMNDRKITSLFVVGADQRPVGLIHIHDCLRAGVI